LTVSVFRVDIPYLEKTIGAGESREHAISYIVEASTWIDALTRGVQRFEEVAHQDFHGWICQLKHDSVRVVDFETGQAFSLSSESSAVPAAPRAAAPVTSRAMTSERRASAMDQLVRAAGDRPPQGAPERVLAVLADEVDVDAASVLLIDEERGDLRFEAATGPKAAEVMKLRVPLSRGVAGFCARSGRAIAVDNAELTSLFDPEISRGVGYPVGAIAAAPIRRGEVILGVIEVLNPRGRTTLTQEELSLVISAGLLLGLALNG
jgi:GAF domain-containing protein